MYDSCLAEDLGAAKLMSLITADKATEACRPLEEPLGLLRIRQNTFMAASHRQLATTHLAYDGIHLLIRNHGEVERCQVDMWVHLIVHVAMYITRNVTNFRSWEIRVSLIVGLRIIL